MHQANSWGARPIKDRVERLSKIAARYIDTAKLLAFSAKSQNFGYKWRARKDSNL
jgi:hypothetical protein